MAAPRLRWNRIFQPVKRASPWGIVLWTMSTLVRPKQVGNRLEFRLEALMLPETVKSSPGPCSVVRLRDGNLVVCDGQGALAVINPECDARWFELAHDTVQLARSIKALPLIVGALHEIAQLEGEEGAEIAGRILLALDLR